MALRRIMFGRAHFLVAVAAVSLAMPLIPAQATPCDACPFDADAVPLQRVDAAVILASQTNATPTTGRLGPDRAQQIAEERHAS